MINRDLIRGEKIRRKTQRFSDPGASVVQGMQSSINLISGDIAMLKRTWLIKGLQLI